MILKGSQRGFGQNLAVHLVRTDENEHVRLHELRGFIADDLAGAFTEAEATSRGTKCRQYLFSLSLNPPQGESVGVEVFERAIGDIEERLGLEGQPRAIVFHEKEGRRHAHAVWSRIDAETMTAKQMSFFKSKLVAVSRELYLENGWKMPRGLENAAERNPTNFSLAEWQQAKRQGIDPRWLKSAVQDCWNRSDETKAFASGLKERGFFLAKGDRRGLVIIDHTGDVHSLPRLLDRKTKDVRDRLGDGGSLPTVADVHRLIGERMTPAMRQHVAEARGQFRERAATLESYRQEMTLLHRKARVRLEERQAREWDSETRERTARLPKGLRGLWHRITGKYQQVRKLNEREARATRERFAREQRELIETQLGQRAVLQKEVKNLRQQQARQLIELRRDIGRYLGFTRGQSQPERDDRALGAPLALER